MRILYLTQWFDPEPTPKGLTFVRGLIDAGHQVEVCTGFPNYPSGDLYPGYRVGLYQKELMRGVTVHRVPLYPNHDNSSWKRAVNYLSFLLSATAFGLFHVGRFDVVYVYHPPITVGLAAALFGGLRNRPFVLDVQDLWPDTLATTGMKFTGTLARRLGPLCDFVYRRAAFVVAQSEGMRERLLARGVGATRVATIYNWADGAADGATAADDEPVDLAAYGYDARFTFVFAGNLGIVQGLDTLVEATKIAAARNPRIRLLIVGDGVEHHRIAALVRAIGLDAVSVRPGVSRARIVGILRAADVLLVHLIDNPLFEVTIPSKVQFNLAMGKPVLIAMKGEAARLVLESGGGVSVPPEQPAALAEAMLALAELPSERLSAMGHAAAESYRSRFSFAAGIAATIRVLEMTASAHARRPPGRARTAASSV